MPWYVKGLALCLTHYQCSRNSSCYDYHCYCYLIREQEGTVEGDQAQSWEVIPHFWVNKKDRVFSFLEPCPASSTQGQERKRLLAAEVPEWQHLFPEVWLHECGGSLPKSPRENITKRKVRSTDRLPFLAAPNSIRLTVTMMQSKMFHLFWK